MLESERDERTKAVNGRQLREFSAAWLVFFCAFGAWQWFGYRDATAALVYCGLGVVVGFAGLGRPSIIRPLFALAMAIALPIGWVMTRVVIGLLFFGLFSPVGWLFRRLQRDPLRLRKPKVASYWSPSRSPANPQSYFRQSL